MLVSKQEMLVQLLTYMKSPLAKKIKPRDFLPNENSMALCYVTKERYIKIQINNDNSNINQRIEYVFEKEELSINNIL